MIYKDEDIIYILTKEDVDCVARELGMAKPTEEQYRMARKYVESFCGEGVYTWRDAIADALRDAKGTERRRHGLSDSRPRRS